jgi:zinc transport system ATP-binding protein
MIATETNDGRGSRPVAVELFDVAAGYDSSVPIIQNVNFSIYDREFFAIIGPNGGGKTTLIKVILGLLDPYAGRSEVFGQSIKHARDLVSYVPQFSTCQREFPITVERMIGLGLQKQSGVSLSPQDRCSRVSQVLEQVGLESMRHACLRELSGGQLQRALIAQALVRQPRLLILDEPTASIDPGGEAALMSLFESLMSVMTVVLVSHDVHYVTHAVSRVACVNRSVVVHDAADLSHVDPHTIYGSPVKSISHGHH